MCMMNKSFALLSIGTALLWSLFVSDPGHAVQIERTQDTRHLMAVEMIRTSNAPTAQLSNTPDPCHVGGKGRTRPLCGNHSLPGSGKVAAYWSQYATAIFTVTLILMLSTLTFLATFSLAVILLAALSRRATQPHVEGADMNPSLNEQGQRSSYGYAAPLYASAMAGWPHRAWVVGLVWFIGFLGSIWFLWITGSIGFFRASNQTD